MPGSTQATEHLQERSPLLSGLLYHSVFIDQNTWWTRHFPETDKNTSNQKGETLRIRDSSRVAYDREWSLALLCWGRCIGTLPHKNPKALKRQSMSKSARRLCQVCFITPCSSRKYEKIRHYLVVLAIEILGLNSFCHFLGLVFPDCCPLFNVHCSRC